MMLVTLYLILAVCLLLLFWTFLGYPLFLYLLSKVLRREHKVDSKYQPTATVIVPCHNEASLIKRKLENLLALDYPQNKLQIIVVDDGSTDTTSNIVESFIQTSKSKNLILLRQKRMGKGSAINMALKKATSEIVVVSDGNAFIEKDALVYVLRHFSDKKVGVVGTNCSHNITVKTSEAIGSSLYQRIAQLFYVLENKIGCTQISYGSLQAIRRSAINPTEKWTPASIDWDLTLSVKQKGYLVVYEQLARSYKKPASKTTDLFKQKKRVIIGTIANISKHSAFLNPFKWGWFSLVFISNKPLQIATPFFIIGLFISSLGVYLITTNTFIYHLLVVQLLAYVVGLFVLLVSNVKDISIQPFPAIKFFVLMQAISLSAWFAYLCGNYDKTWEPIKSSR